MTSKLSQCKSNETSQPVAFLIARIAAKLTSATSPTDDDTLSRLTLTTQGDEQMAEQIVKQIHKLIDTIKGVDLTVGSHIERELMLVKIKASEPEVRAELKSSVEIFRGHVVDVTASTYTVQLTGDSDKLDAFIDAVREIGIMEVVRSGVSGISRGDKFLRV